MNIQERFTTLPDRIKNAIRKPEVWGFFVSMLVIMAVSLLFFSPDNFEGHSLAQQDMQQGMANGHEGQEYEAQTGEKALWTNSLFSGMPTFQISPEYPSNHLFTWLNSLYGMGLPAPSNLMFMMMFGFLIMLTCLRLRWWYSLIGALAWGLSSYFIIIIGAGHIWKFVALSYVPPTIGGLIMIYRGRRIAGAALLALFMMMELNANHPQITYYFAFLMVFLAIGYLVYAIRHKMTGSWLINSSIALGACVLAIAANLPSLYNTYEYSKETKRAASELTPVKDNDAAASDEQPTGGLPKAEIGGWSNLPEESFSLLIPNIKGGASIKPERGGMRHLSLDLNDNFDSEMAAAAPQIQDESGQIRAFPYYQLTEYFGGKGGTNGPFYVGAIIFALFLLGCFIVKGPVKWVLLIATVFSALLAMGNHFQTLTDFMIYNVPLYNKFRAAETALVIACLCMPLMAMLALQKLFSTPEPFKDRQTVRGLSVALVFPMFICLVAYFVPSVFGNPITAEESQYLATLPSQFDAANIPYDKPYLDSIISNIENIRYGIVSADAGRSFLFLLLGAGAIIYALKYRKQRAWAVLALGLFITIDLWAVDKRYVDSDNFVSGTTLAYENVFDPTQADLQIMADTSYYRVADLQGFNDYRRSYFHHMIGGYHAAKLNRYNDLLERRLLPGINNTYQAIAQSINDSIEPSGSDWNLLSMLNTKYIIVPAEKGEFVYENKQALGPAWLVDTLKYVANADAEMAALQTLDPSTSAVADQRFKTLLGDQAVAHSEGDYIHLEQYSPNRLAYTTDTKNGGIAVFSEVWFPWGWHATIDGKEAQLGRVNYVLRALRLPAGKHTVVMTFDPQSIHVTSAIAYAGVSLIYLLAALALFMAVISKEKEPTGKA